jgi:hypothetical protein
MLFPRPALDGIARAKVTCAFRRWDRPRVRAGARLRTAIGVVEVVSVDEVDPAAISDGDARTAGHADRDDLLATLARHTGRGPTVYRIGLRFAGADPRVALRQRADLTPAEADALRARLDRFDGASRHGPWTARVLRLISERPGVRAGDLATLVGRERLAFKADVRKLKELGLTESLEVGYRLSPRGAALLPTLADPKRP